MTVTATYSPLTAREREVIAFMALGYSNQGICDALVIAPKTLETHIQRVFSKLDVLPAPRCHRRVCAVLAWMGQRSVIDVTEASGATPMWNG